MTTKKQDVIVEALLWERIVDIDFESDGLDGVILTLELQNGTKISTRDYVIVTKPDPQPVHPGSEQKGGLAADVRCARCGVNRRWADDALCVSCIDAALAEQKGG